MGELIVCVVGWLCDWFFEFIVYIWDGRIILNIGIKERFSAYPGSFEYLLALFARCIVISPQDRVATIKQDGH